MKPHPFWMRELPFSLVLIAAVLGIAYTSISKTAIVLYWEVLAPAIWLVCIASGWHSAQDRAARVRLLATQTAHWVSFLIVMNLLLLPGVQKLFNANATGLAVFTLLTLGTFTAGVHVAVLDEVVGPDVIGMLGPQADAGAGGQPQPSAFGLLGRHFQPLPPPDALYPAVADRPARLTQQGSDLAIAIAAVLAGELDDVSGQTVGIFSAPRHLALRRAVLPERRTGATLGDVQVLTNVLDAGATTRGA